VSWPKSLRFRRKTPHPIRSLTIPLGVAPNDCGRCFCRHPAHQAGALSPSQNGYFTLDYFPLSWPTRRGFKAGSSIYRPPLAGGSGESSSAVSLPPPDWPRSCILRTTSLAFKPSNRSDFSFELWTRDRQRQPVILRKGPVLSEPLDSANSVRFSKLDHFE